jgi:beta-N-acetylglucosaminidase
VFKKVYLTLSLFIFSLILVVAPAAHAADDITGHYFEKEMRELIKLGILGGYGEGVYLPDRDVTRAEFAAFLLRTLKSEVEVKEPKKFKDVAEKDWYYKDVQEAYALGIINGYTDGTFGPNKKISREEMAAMVDKALQSKGIILEKSALPYKDTNTIQTWALESVQRMYGKIMNGNPDNTFAPKTYAKRGMTSAILSRALVILNPPKSLDYSIATVSGTTITPGKQYDTFDAAKSAVTQDNQVVVKGGKIVYMKPSTGIVAANTLMSLNSKSDLTGYTVVGVSAGSEAQYLDATENWIKVKVIDKIGYIDPMKANLYPKTSTEYQNRSSYTVSGGLLVHRIYNPLKNTAASYTYGPTTTFLKEGYKYYSWDGRNFTNTSGTSVGKYYSYFNLLPLYTKTSYTADQLNSYLASNPNATNTEFNKIGNSIVKVQNEYNVNGLYMLAHSILESNWGTSRLALEKKNIFGLGAIDSCPFDCAQSFNTYEESIEQGLIDRFLLTSGTGYLVTGGWRNQGEFLGNKNAGLNVFYASDPYWGQKIAGLMYKIDTYLKGNERNKYQLAITNVANVKVRSGTTSTTEGNILYYFKTKETSVVFQSETSNTEGTWYKIAPKNINGGTFTNTYIYSNGSKGNNASKITTH